MRFTIGWLKEHLDTKYKDNKIIEKLTDIGLEVENFGNIGSERLDIVRKDFLLGLEVYYPGVERFHVVGCG